MSNGFWLSLDGILAIIIIVSVLLSLPILTEKDFTELVVLQKQHDLLKVWHIQKTVDIAEMQEDIEWLFPNQGFVLTVNDITIQKKLPYQF
ncbi:hypothetical protein KKE06_03530, partial [Candidatus Micrarchaeota archaeon]|nr:hypothetical protein [Candidatus Micrarchaeota archaeon]MBU1930963.1 hypothetical protein [Candidatus Micrarchaeota archaeon]